VTAPAIPTSPTELEDWLSDGKQVMQSMKDGTFKDHIKAYAASFAKKDEDFGRQVQEETQRVLAQWLRDNKDKGVTPSVPLNLNYQNGVSNKYNKIQNPNAIGAPLNGAFPDVSTFLQTVWNNQDGNKFRKANASAYETLLNYQEKVPSEGGFLVPEEFRAELLRMSLTRAVVRPRARVIPMASATLRFPKIDETSRVSSVFGGVVVYRTEEGAELAESQASFGSIKLEATKQTALAHVTNELVRDWGAFGVFIEEIFPEAISHYEDLDYLAGSGVGEPLGALAPQNGAIIAVAKETGQTADTIVWENVIRMYARMLPSSVARAVWVASPDTFVELATMALTVGTGGTAVWLTNGTEAPVLTLLGRPVIMDEKAPGVLGDQGDLSFVDFGMYLIGDRQQMTVDSSEHVKFTSDKTTYRVIQRNDGRPWIESALTPQNGSATLSPFVQLAARA
jgi:HK97 family phage major capsid protein